MAFFSLRSLKSNLSLTLLLLFWGSQPVFAQAFITRWNSSYPGGNANQIVIPATGNYHIDWHEVANPSNSGSQSASGEVTITFPSPGLYEVSITGGLTAITFNNDITKSSYKIMSIEQWGNIAWSTMENAFYGCLMLSMNATDAPDLANVTSAKYMFYNCMYITCTISHWDVSSITDMSYMLCVQNFNEDLNSWDVSNVTTMEAMFYYTQTFNGDISSWNVSNVTNMRYMFCSSAFNRNIGSWDVSKVTDMDAMFYQNAAFNQPIGNWDVANVTRMYQMFELATAFNQPIGNWNVSKVTEMRFMFSDANAFNQDLGLWDISSVPLLNWMFRRATSFNQSLASWNVSNVTDMWFMLDNSGLSVSNYDATLIAWNNQLVGNNVRLGAQGLKYCAALSQRNNLINSNAWVITGDALNCSLAMEQKEESNIGILSKKSWIAYPNPWNISESTAFKLEGVSGKVVHVSLINEAGRVAEIGSIQTENGAVEISANTLGIHSQGLYLLKITSDNEVYTAKLSIIE